MKRQPLADKAAKFLASLTGDLTTLLSLRELAEGALEALAKEAGFTCCVIGVLGDHNPDTLTVVGASGPARSVRGAELRRGNGLPWSVLEDGLSIYIPDIDSEPSALRFDDLYHSGLYAPLVTRERPIGVLMAYRRRVNAFSTVELDLFATVAKHLASACEVARVCERHRTLAATDPLTSLMNRRALSIEFQNEMNRSRRTGQPMTVAMLDLDKFKVINDSQGHLAGDLALTRVAETLRQRLRSCDRVARWGGDEFVLLLPGVTAARAGEILQRVRRIEMPWDGEPESAALTVSWGLASWPADAESLDGLVQTADTRLSTMKKLERIGRTPVGVA
ncbi:MAG TPA: sensor domain-containing diguanylate cyclase [bacterium]|nr:sensor domain-containing diguanylate cyclase [bacterium]